MWRDLLRATGACKSHSDRAPILMRKKLSRAPAHSAPGQAVYVELYRRIERVADRLFEGEEAVLHLIERIVTAWVYGSTQRHFEWTRDFGTALGCRPVFSL
jgi:hypothetical protein